MFLHTMITNHHYVGRALKKHYKANVSYVSGFTPYTATPPEHICSVDSVKNVRTFIHCSFEFKNLWLHLTLD